MYLHTSAVFVSLFKWLLFIGASKYLICSVQEPLAIDEFNFGGLTIIFVKEKRAINQIWQ